MNEEYVPDDHELELFNANCMKEAKIIKLSRGVTKAMPEIVINCFGKDSTTKVLNLLKNHKLEELNLKEHYSGGEYRSRLLVSNVIVANYKGFVNALSDYVRWIKELNICPIHNSRNFQLPDLHAILTGDDKYIQKRGIIFEQDNMYSSKSLNDVEGYRASCITTTKVSPSTTTKVSPSTTTKVSPSTTTKVSPSTTTKVSPSTTTKVSPSTTTKVSPSTTTKVSPSTTTKVSPSTTTKVSPSTTTPVKSRVNIKLRKKTMADAGFK